MKESAIVCTVPDERKRWPFETASRPERGQPAASASILKISRTFVYWTRRRVAVGPRRELPGFVDLR